MTEFQDGTLITMEVMSSQVYAIRKVIRPLFAGLVTERKLFIWTLLALEFQS